MKTVKTFQYISVFFSLTVTSLHAGSVTPGGVSVITLYGNMDNYIAFPYSDTSLCTCLISAVGESLLVLSEEESGLQTMADNGAFGEDRLYFAEFTTGELAGTRYDILGYSNRSLFLATEGDDLRSHPAGTVSLDDQVRIVPHWTLNKVFGDSNETVVIEPTVTPLAIKDLVFLPKNLKPGINKTPDGFYFLSGQGWRKISDPFTDQGDTVLPPGEGLVVRRRTSGDTEIVSFGTNRNFPFMQFVPGGDGASANDALLALQFPEPVTLNESGLAEIWSDGKQPVEASANSLLLKDIVYLYEPGSETPKLLFYMNGQGWFDAALGATPVGDSQLIKPGSAFYIRKSALSASTDWTFDASQSSFE